MRFSLVSGARTSDLRRGSGCLQHGNRLPLPANVGTMAEAAELWRRDSATSPLAPLNRPSPQKSPAGPRAPPPGMISLASRKRLDDVVAAFRGTALSSPLQALTLDGYCYRDYEGRWQVRGPVSIATFWRPSKRPQLGVPVLVHASAAHRTMCVTARLCRALSRARPSRIGTRPVTSQRASPSAPMPNQAMCSSFRRSRRRGRFRHHCR